MRHVIAVLVVLLVVVAGCHKAVSPTAAKAPAPMGSWESLRSREGDVLKYVSRTKKFPREEPCFVPQVLDHEAGFVVGSANWLDQRPALYRAEAARSLVRRHGGEYASRRLAEERDLKFRVSAVLKEESLHGEYSYVLVTIETSLVDLLSRGMSLKKAQSLVREAASKSVVATFKAKDLNARLCRAADPKRVRTVLAQERRELVQGARTELEKELEYRQELRKELRELESLLRERREAFEEFGVSPSLPQGMVTEGGLGYELKTWSDVMDRVLEIRKYLQKPLPDAAATEELERVDRLQARFERLRRSS